MPQFLIEGVARGDGTDRTMLVVAECAKAAEFLANERGLLVSRCVPHVDPPPGLPLPAPASEVPAGPGASPRLSVPRAIVASLCAAGMLATFLPWVSIPLAGSTPGSEGVGWLSFAMFVAALTFALSPSPRAPLGIGRRILCSVFALLAVGVAALALLAIDDLRSSPRAGLLDAASRPGVGIHVVFAAGGAIVVAAILARNPKG